ncbi:DUF899 domain-containing protein [Nocardia mexicana]|uniref:Putative dithiol-disulfide oxidoreductase (DUF899 family) n=1 Tax=Nocardia mexicana TaxID=279262 RepID=A0A370H1B0_9NOCA|nr:DUF899 domain-containing protein [Nocardia mexicana]RDI49637.1 putative dithiol-disulfide oxidoreductase (DUF899 family) [Nocardia mexicana]
MALPQIVSQDEWLTARKELLQREKELARARDTLNADRRRLPMVRIDKDYRFAGPDGEVGLLDLFGDRPQLIVQHLMFDPAWDGPCGSCTAMADGLGERIRAQLRLRGTAFAAISRAPYSKLAAVSKDKGWTFPWFSSHDSDFNYDFHVTLDPAVQPAYYNYRDADELVAAGMDWMIDFAGEQPGISTFLRDGDEVFHTYSTYHRGVEVMMPAYWLLDLTSLGRQEEWEEPKGRAPELHEVDPILAH